MPKYKGYGSDDPQSEEEQEDELDRLSNRSSLRDDDDDAEQGYTSETGAPMNAQQRCAPHTRMDLAPGTYVLTDMLFSFSKETRRAASAHLEHLRRARRIRRVPRRERRALYRLLPRRPSRRCGSAEAPSPDLFVCATRADAVVSIVPSFPQAVSKT
jgi:hypothetical protein